MILILLYVLLSAFGLIFLKLGVNNGTAFTFEAGMLNIKLNVYLLIGMVMYICSFLTSLIAMSKLDLNLFYPVSAGLVFTFVCVGSYWILKENFTLTQIIGCVIILIGIVVINIKR